MGAPSLLSNPRRVLLAGRAGGRGGRVAAGHAAPRPRLALPQRAEDGRGQAEADAALPGGQERDLHRDFMLGCVIPWAEICGHDKRASTYSQ